MLKFDEVVFIRFGFLTAIPITIVWHLIFKLKL